MMFGIFGRFYYGLYWLERKRVLQRVTQTPPRPKKRQKNCPPTKKIILFQLTKIQKRRPLGGFDWRARITCRDVTCSPANRGPFQR
jgi:hypothetical protein